MADSGRSALQDALADAVARSGKTRDSFDALLRKKLGTTGKPLWDIERGKTRRPTPMTLRAIEDVFGMAEDALVDLVHPRASSPPTPAPVAASSPARNSTPPVPTADGDEIVEIAQLDLSLSMGPGTLIEDFPEEETARFSLAFVKAITRTPSNRLRLVRGIGDSMEPTLRSGDQVMVDINEHQLSRSHGVYWIDHLGTHGIKRLRASARGKVLVMSDNPLVPDFEVDAEDLRIEGRVIWFARDV